MTNILNSAVIPNPLISRGLQVYASHNQSMAGNLTDGSYFGPVWHSGETLPCWAAIKLEGEYSKLLVYQKVKGWGPYDDPGYCLVNYEIQVSADSTDGSDGQWSTVITVSNNDKQSRVHSFDFAGMRWVRLSITGWDREGDHGALEAIDIHDASKGIEDTYIFMGDSIYAGAFGQRNIDVQPDFAATIHAKDPARMPVMVNGAHGAMLSSWGEENIEAFLTEQPDIRYWCINFGMNDSWGDSEGDTGKAEAFKERMEVMVQAVQAAGRIPVLAPISYATGDAHLAIPFWNSRIKSLIKKYKTLTGPDLYTWFKQHQDELSSDGVHPNAKGYQSINRLWGECMLALTQDQAPAKGKDCKDKKKKKKK